jgi:endonuclease/exonuclease/phosphatase family metal-dependent hydrolase
MASDVTWWAGLAVALAVVLGLQVTRVFVSDLVFVVDQSRRLVLLGLIAIVFASPVLAPLVGRLSGGRLLPVATVLLVATRAGLQFVDWPLARLILAAVGFAAVNWMLIPLLRWRARAGLGILAGAGLDLALRTARTTIDLPWNPGLGSHLATAGLLVLLLVAVVLVVADRGPVEPRGALGFFAFGPALGLFHLLTGHIGFAIVHTGWPLAAASALLGFALLVGLASFPLAGRHWLGWVLTALLGAGGCWLAWDDGWRAAIGIAAAALAWTVLTGVVALGGRPLRVPASVLRIASALALGNLLQVALLFRYYTATGDHSIVLALFGLVALFAALEWPRAWPAGTVALLPHIALLVAGPLAGALVWQLLTTRVQEPVPRAGGNDLLVVTYNIQSGYDRQHRWDLEATAQAIERLQPDIVLLQEVSRGWLVTSSADQLTWLSRRLGMQAAWGPASDDGLWGNAVLSHGQPLEIRTTRFRVTENLQRGAIAVRLAPPTGSLWVASTHLDDPRQAVTVRLAQIEELLVFLQPMRPLVLGGDFNAEPGSPELIRLSESGLIDAAAAVGATDPTSADDRRIDYLFITDELRPLAGSVPPISASDHRPVVVRLALP